MNHQDALREMSVEKYLLGELTGASRDTFEEHLFECQACAADLTSSVTFAEAARLDLAAEATEKVRLPQKTRSWADWLRPQWLAPAFAFSLLLLAGQTLFRIPTLERELARAESPRILNNLTLTDGASRGGGEAQVVAPEKGAFLLSVDLPSGTSYSMYVCSLYAPSGKQVWQGSVSPSLAGDTVQISVPAAATQAGENTLLIQGSHGTGAAGATLDDLRKYKFFLELQK